MSGPSTGWIERRVGRSFLERWADAVDMAALEPEGGHRLDEAVVGDPGLVVPPTRVPDLDAVDGSDHHGVTVEMCELAQALRDGDAPLAVGADLVGVGGERSQRLAFAGDYLIGPYTEMALTSGLRAATDVARGLTL